jgi:hypothetical protein
LIKRTRHNTLPKRPIRRCYLQIIQPSNKGPLMKQFFLFFLLFFSLNLDAKIIETKIDTPQTTKQSEITESTKQKITDFLILHADKLGICSTIIDFTIPLSLYIIYFLWDDTSLLPVSTYTIYTLIALIIIATPTNMLLSPLSKYALIKKSDALQEALKKNQIESTQ